MTDPTPSDVRKRKSGVDSFETWWYADVKTSEIRRKPLKGWSKFLDLFWSKKHKVPDLYWWVSKNWAAERMMPFPIAIKHDDIPASGFPRKHQLQGGWTIPDEDLKYLYEGPLFDQSGHKILVNYQSGFRRFISIVSQLKPLSWIIGFALICSRYWSEIENFFEYLQNAI